MLLLAFVRQSGLKPLLNVLSSRSSSLFGWRRKIKNFNQTLKTTLWELHWPARPTCSPVLFILLILWSLIFLCVVAFINHQFQMYWHLFTKWVILFLFYLFTFLWFCVMILSSSWTLLKSFNQLIARSVIKKTTTHIEIAF